VELKTTGNTPPPCCYHAAAIVGDIIYVFGGFNVWSLDTLFAFEIPSAFCSVLLVAISQSEDLRVFAQHSSGFGLKTRGSNRVNAIIIQWCL
jgi:hypothetical protein